MRLFDMVACLQSRASYWKIGPLIESLKSILFSIFFLAGNERIRHCKCLENFRCECSLQSLYQSKPDLCFLEWIKTKRYLLEHMRITIIYSSTLVKYSSNMLVVPLFEWFFVFLCVSAWNIKECIVMVKHLPAGTKLVNTYFV